MLDARVVAAYLAGTVCGAVLTALVAWVLSGFTEPLPDGTRLALLGAGGAVLWAAKHGPLREVLRLPEARRQIPAELRYRAHRHQGCAARGESSTPQADTHPPSTRPGPASMHSPPTVRSR
jgi:hypothetical protein